MKANEVAAPTEVAKICSDCGRRTEQASYVLDPRTHVVVSLCPICRVAFLQYQHFRQDAAANNTRNSRYLTAMRNQSGPRTRVAGIAQHLASWYRYP